MQLNLLDWSIITASLLFSLFIGLYYSKRASRSLKEFFTAEGSLPWWLVGTSMVATTFAADTPLVVSGLVRKGVPADDSFISRYWIMRDASQRLTCRENLCGVDLRRHVEEIAARRQRHNRLLRRTVAGALANAVYRAFDLAGAAANCSQRIRHRHAEIVMAMHGERDFVSAFRCPLQKQKQIQNFFRRRVADRVGNIDGGSSGLNRRFDRLNQIVPFGPDRIFSGKFDVVADRPCEGNDV